MIDELAGKSQVHERFQYVDGSGQQYGRHGAERRYGKPKHQQQNWNENVQAGFQGKRNKGHRRKKTGRILADCR